MKSFTGTLIAVFAIVGISAASDTITVDPKSLSYVNPVDQGPGPVKSISTASPYLFEGIGPELFPGMPGYKDPFAQSGSSSSWGSIVSSESGSAASKCAQACPDEYSPVCGSDGVTYSNSCELGVASCNNPNKGIAKKSDGPCSS
ncbi:unnamed protein product [Phytophthora lilii]|uniref:Unnamed protein product n=1 Tax=Phytophthora lilii TaxID=2077276 RepID=A0A9W6WYE4_9STRA|nr:unnamed protein product [Phytophthora lilii]